MTRGFVFNRKVGMVLMKRKTIFSILTAVVCTMICILSVFSAGAEVSSNLQVKTVYCKSNQKLVESKTYTDADGNPVVAADKGYATIAYQYTTANQVKRLELRDAEGNLVNGKEGYAVRTTKYVDKKVSEQCYYDANGNPVTGPEGYARMVTEFQGGRPLSIWRYDPEGNPVGWHKITEYTKVGEANKVSSETWYDPENQLLAGPNGYARVEYAYTDGQVSRIRYIGADGMPYYYAKAGYATKDSVYSGRKLREVRYYDGEDKPCKGPDGYSYVIYTYSDAGKAQLAMYYAADGGPYFNENGVCGVERWYGDKNRVVEERYYIGEGIRGRSKDGYSGVKRSYNQKGKIVLERFYNEEDQLMVVASLGYAKVKRDYHNGKYLDMVSYFDENGDPMAGPEGVPVIQNIYETGNNKIKTTKYLDGNGKKLVNNVDGYARIEYTRDDNKNPLTTRYFDADGNPVIGEHGEDEIRNTWKGSNKTSESYWLGGEPITGIDGYHRVEIEYTGSGKVFRKTFYGTDGELTLCTEGYAGIETEYNSKGKVMSTRHYGTDGNLMLTPGKEYAFVRTVLFADREMPEETEEEEEPEADPETTVWTGLL